MELAHAGKRSWRSTTEAANSTIPLPARDSDEAAPTNIVRRQSAAVERGSVLVSSLRRICRDDAARYPGRDVPGAAVLQLKHRLRSVILQRSVLVALVSVRICGSRRREALRKCD